MSRGETKRRPTSAGPVNAHVAQAVAARREELRMTQREAADRAGLKRNTLLYLEWGKQHWTVDLLAAVAGALEVTPGVFFPQGEPADEMELALVAAFRRGGWPEVLKIAARSIEE